MKEIVTHETQHGSAKRLANIIAQKLNVKCINVDTPFEAEDETQYNTLICVFNFRGPYTAQLTKLFLERMQGKLNNKHLILVGEGLFSEKEFPVVADKIHKLCDTASFNTFFVKGQLRVATLTTEEQALLAKFSEITGMKIEDMGEFDTNTANDIAEKVQTLVDNAPVTETAVKKKWVCTVCGYIHEGDEPPESCPLCGQPKEMFKEMK